MGQCLEVGGSIFSMLLKGREKRLDGCDGSSCGVALLLEQCHCRREPRAEALEKRLILGVGALVIAAGVIFAVIRFFGEVPPGQNLEAAVGAAVAITAAVLALLDAATGSGPWPTTTPGSSPTAPATPTSTRPPTYDGDQQTAPPSPAPITHIRDESMCIWQEA